MKYSCGSCGLPYTGACACDVTQPYHMDDHRNPRGVWTVYAAEAGAAPGCGTRTILADGLDARAAAFCVYGLRERAACTPNS